MKFWRIKELPNGLLADMPCLNFKEKEEVMKEIGSLKLSLELLEQHSKITGLPHKPAKNIIKNRIKDLNDYIY